MKFDPVLLDAAAEPDEALLSTTLGPALAWLRGLGDLCPGFDRAWRHYGSKYGWRQRVFDAAKTVYEVVPLAGALGLTIAVRGEEWEALEGLDLGPAGERALQEARGQAEGYGIKLYVGSEAAFEAAQALVACIVAQRSGEDS